jgi:hypothetical protein
VAFEPGREWRGAPKFLCTTAATLKGAFVGTFLTLLCDANKWTY